MSFFKVPVYMHFFCFVVIFMFAEGGGYLAIGNYFPAIILLILVFCINVFSRKVKFRLEHLAMSFFFITVLFHISAILGMFPASKTAGGLLLYLSFFAAVLFTPNEKDLNYAAKAFIISGMIFSMLILIFRYEYEPGRYSVFLYGYPADPNHLASFLVLSCIIAFKKACFPAGQEKPALYFPAFFCILLAVFMTGSRMAFIGLLIGLFILLFKDIKKFLPLTIFVALVFLTAFCLIPDDLTERFLHNSYNDKSNQTRVLLWRQAWNAVKLHPLIGYGPIDSRILSSYGAAHNTVLSMLLYFGLIGTSFLSVVFVKIIKGILSGDMRLFLSLFAALAFMSLIIENTVVMPFWFILIFIMWAVNIKRDNPSVCLWKEI